MPFNAILLFALAGALLIAALAMRERAAANAKRRIILDPVLRMFDAPKLTVDRSGFPKLEGQLHGENLRVALIPDTMTIRRLPQLWLEVTMRCDLPIEDQGLAILIRPSGADYYSLTERMKIQLAPPKTFPFECLVKGESSRSQQTLDRIADRASRHLADPRVKEIAVTKNGLRMIRQLAEGKRGEHLLLRQSVFVNAQLMPGDLAAITEALRDIKAAVLTPIKASAA